MSGLLSILIGIGLLAAGIIQIITSIQQRAFLAFPLLRLTVGVILCAAGLVFMLYRNTPVWLFGIFFGVWALVSASLK